MNIFVNIARLASFWFLGDSYRAYSVAIRVFKLFSRRGHIASFPDYSQATLLIAGFGHSGNTFLRANIIQEHQSRVISHIHFSWAVKHAVRNGVSVAVLMRTPLEVAESWYFRSGGNTPIWVILCCWIGYYRSLEKFRSAMLVIPFPELLHGYERLRARLQQSCGMALNSTPDDSRRNTFEGRKYHIQLSVLEKRLMKCANGLYERHVGGSHPSPISRWQDQTRNVAAPGIQNTM